MADIPYDREMTVLEHLQELRFRIIVSTVAILVGLVIAAGWLTWPIMHLLTDPAEITLNAITPGETFFAYLQVARVTGVALAMPVIVYQILRFVMPALHPNERRYVYAAVPAITIAFLIGLAFGFYLVVPFAVRYLMGFGGDVVRAVWSVNAYLSFVSTLLFWIGVSFETPIFIFFLAKLGVVNARQLAHYRKFALIGAFVIGAIITPTPDPLNQTIVAVPLYLLYEFGIFLARFATPARVQA